MATAQTLLTDVSSNSSSIQLSLKSWGASGVDISNTPVTQQQYIGYNTNWGTYDMDGYALESYSNESYSGYNTNWGEVKTNNINYAVPTSNDINSVIDRPKDQTLYYKLRGYNTSTQSYETWIITEKITSRPELYNPDVQPPNIDLDIYTTAPSGHNLINISIVSRWIE